MAEEPPAPPPAPVFLDEEVALRRIEANVTNARTIWFTQLAFLAFVSITLLSVRDLDFFSVTSRISLPLLGVTIPTPAFFWVAAWLAAILHVYFHLFLLKLWDALAEAPPSVDSLPLGERVFPWLVIDWALRLRPDQATVQRPMDRLATWVTELLIWLATPFLLAAFWWRSMPAHDASLTIAIAVAFAISLYTSLKGWLRAQERLRYVGHRAKPEGGSSLPDFWRRWAAVIGIVLAVVSLLRTQVGHIQLGPFEWRALWHAPIDLIGAEIAEEPADWLGRDTAGRRFKIGWCRDRDLPPDACQEPVEPYQEAARVAWCGDRPIDDCDAEFERLDALFTEEWQEQRGEYLANLTRPNLGGRDLRGAIAPGAFLAGVDLSNARLEGADLWGARLEGADFSEARLDGAILREARLEGANLSQARLEGANLSQARLEGAILFGARLEEANLSQARLEGANLFVALLERALLLRARLDGAILSFARLEEANLSFARLEEAKLSFARLERANLWEARLEGADLSEARLEGANLFGARLEGANLSQARLEGANLRAARLEGAGLSGARLRSVEWAGATFAASPAHSTDFTAGRNLTQSQFAQVIDDGDTILPLDAETGEQLYVWTCWPEPPPNLGRLLEMEQELKRDTLRAQWLCPPGVAPEPTGRPADPDPAAPSAD